MLGKGLQSRIYYVVFSILIGISLFLIYKNLFRNNDLRVIFLDVGQGDSSLIITPNGRTILIDAGKNPGLGTSLSKYMPSYDRDIDVVIGTHPDADHIGGLSSIFEDYRVGLFLHSGFIEDSLLYKNLVEKINDTETKIITAHAGQHISLDQELFLDIFSPYSEMNLESKNEYSVITRLTYKERSFLFMGDASIFNEQGLIDVYGDMLQSDVLKVGHHGSKTSSSKLFIQVVQPEYGIISAGCDNSFGHPHQSVLNTLFQILVTILNTCSEGDIYFSTDGGYMVVK